MFRHSPFSSASFLRFITLLFAFGLLQACADDGSDGAAGAPGAPGAGAVDTGTISVTVTSSGNPVAGATVSTNPASASQDTDAAGVATLTGVPIGVYDVMAEIAGTNIETMQQLVGVAAGATTNVSLSLANVPGTITGRVLGPDGTDGDTDPDPIVGAIVSTPGSMQVTTDANGDFVLDMVTRSFISVEPPAGSTYLPGGTRTSIGPGENVEIRLTDGPSSSATYVANDTCIFCHSAFQPGLVAAWQSSGHYRVVERSLIEMDTTGWPADPGANLCSTWEDTGVDANDPSEPSSSAPSHSAYVRTCNDDPDLRFEVLVDGDDNGADAGDTTVTVYATYGGPGSAAGEVDVLQARGEATDLHGAWKQRYMFSIADLNTCSVLNPEGTHFKPPRPAFVTWDTSQTCEDMLITPIQYNQRTDEWVPYHTDNWYTQGRTYSKKCSGCHEAGVTLTAVSGMVTEYAAADYRIGCQKCHGPGSEHISGAGASSIINPTYLTAVSAREMCGQCHSRGAEPLGVFSFPWRTDVTDFDGNFVPGLHQLDWDAVDAPAGYYLQKPGLWPDGHSKKHHQQYNDFLASTHIDNPWETLTCHDCHSPHSGRGGPFQIERADFTGNEFVFGDNQQALMSNVVCLNCHASHGPFATLTLDNIAVYHTANGGTVEVNGVPLMPSMTEQTSASDLVEQAVKAHSGERAGMPLAPYQPEESAIPENYQLGQGPVGRCASCHMTKTAKSATWFVDADNQVIEGDASNHTFDIVGIQAGTDQPNSCGKCHDSFRTTSAPPGGD